MPNGIQWGFPFAITTGGLVAGATEDAHVRQLIEQCLFTNPGERVMRPTFGVGVGQLVFETMSAAHVSAAQSLIQAQLRTNLAAEITVLSVTATALDSSDGTLAITIEYVRVGSRQPTALQVIV